MSDPKKDFPFRVEVIADSSGKWCGNGLHFATAREAEDYAIDLSCRWTAVSKYRVLNGDTVVVSPDEGIG